MYLIKIFFFWFVSLFHIHWIVSIRGHLFINDHNCGSGQVRRLCRENGCWPSSTTRSDFAICVDGWEERGGVKKNDVRNEMYTDACLLAVIGCNIYNFGSFRSQVRNQKTFSLMVFGCKSVHTRTPSEYEKRPDNKTFIAMCFFSFFFFFIRIILVWNFCETLSVNRVALSTATGATA